MGVIIPESDMQFGEYREDQVFQIEKCSQYTSKLRQNGIKSCEFILLRGNKLYFVEAKKSCPNQITAESTEEKIIKYKNEIQEIVLKMKHSLTLYANILLKRYSIQGLPDKLKDISDLEIRLVLVVKNAEKAWLAPFQDVFRRELKDEMKIWKIPDFIVINEEKAREKRFIL